MFNCIQYRDKEISKVNICDSMERVSAHGMGDLHCNLIKFIMTLISSNSI